MRRSAKDLADKHPAPPLAAALLQPPQGHGLTRDRAPKAGFCLAGDAGVIVGVTASECRVKDVQAGEYKTSITVGGIAGILAGVTAGGGDLLGNTSFDNMSGWSTQYSAGLSDGAGIGVAASVSDSNKDASSAIIGMIFGEGVGVTVGKTCTWVF